MYYVFVTNQIWSRPSILWMKNQWNFLHIYIILKVFLQFKGHNPTLLVLRWLYQWQNHDKVECNKLEPPSTGNCEASFVLGFRWSAMKVLYECSKSRRLNSNDCGWRGWDVLNDIGEGPLDSHDESQCLSSMAIWMVMTYLYFCPPLFSGLKKSLHLYGPSCIKWERNVGRVLSSLWWSLMWNSPSQAMVMCLNLHVLS